jgi:hypothetical protein
MKIYLAGAKDKRLEDGCLSLCDEETSYKRLFSFYYRKDVDFFVKEYQGILKFRKE